MNRRTFLLSSMAGLGLSPLLAQDLSAGLQLELLQEQTRDLRPRLLVTFSNRTNSPLVLDIGIVLGNGAYAGCVQFLLRDSQNRMRRLIKRDPGIIAGWAAPYIVEISAGRAFHLRSIDLIDYWSLQPKVTVLHLPAGVYSLVATFQGRDPNKTFLPPAQGQQLIHRWPQTFWTGDITSNAINVRFNSRV